MVGGSGSLDALASYALAAARSAARSLAFTRAHVFRQPVIYDYPWRTAAIYRAYILLRIFRPMLAWRLGSSCVIIAHRKKARYSSVDAAANFGCRNVGISASSPKAVNLCPILPVSSVWLAVPLTGAIYSLRWSSSECRKLTEMLPAFDGNNFGKLDRNQQQPMPIMTLTFDLDRRTWPG